MSFRFTWLLIPLLLLLIEGGVQGWRNSKLETSKAPMFFWKESELLTSADSPFGSALKVYKPDRGGEQEKLLSEERKMHVFYFEWDRYDAGARMDIGGHQAEVCNVAAGFKLLKSGTYRTHQFPNGEKLRFDSTLLAQPDGKPVYMFKVVWLQGLGTWGNDIDKEHDRLRRVRRSFLRNRGAARVLQAGMYGTKSEDEAWALFEEEVLAKLEWSEPGRPNPPS